MNNDIQSQRSLRTLIEAIAAGTAEPAERLALEAQLRRDPSARRLYREFFTVEALLTWNLRGQSVDGRPVQEAGASSAPVVDANDSVGDEGRKSWTWLPTSLTSSELFVGSMVVAVVLAAATGLMYTLRSGKIAPVNSPNAAAFAQLTRTNQCRWKDATPPPSVDAAGKKRLIAGQVLELESGVLEIVYDSGARLTIEGPAHVAMSTPGSCQIDSGRLVAFVPPAASGFTVMTPQTIIVDIGTEFGVIVEDSQTSDIAVFRGEIQIESRQAAADGSSVESSRVRLKAGQSRRIERGELRLPAEPLDASTAFVRDITRSSSHTPERKARLVSLHKPVQASSEWHPESHFFPPSNVVDGVLDDTVTNGQHSWWMAADDVPAELIVDLENVFEVVEIRMQNSDAEYSDRGAREVVVSLSLNGRDYTDVATIELAKVQGRSKIDIDQVFLATPIAARYVRLQIPTHYDRGAALNEIQVFAIPH